MLILIEKQELHSRGEIEDECNRVDNAMESAIDAKTSLLELYIKNKDMENSKKVVLEIDKIEEEFTTEYEAARRCLDSQNENSSEASVILSTDLLNRMNVSNQSERSTEERQNASKESSIDRHTGAALYETSKKVGLVNYGNIRHSTPLKRMKQQSILPLKQNKKS